jgi:O-acetyl-ADP-ribose deacetylase (regulator of RNase III)
MPIHYIQGDATSPQGKGPKVVAHIVNSIGKWGKGFVMAASSRWPDARAQYLKWHQHRAANDFGLGAVQFLQVEPWIWVANMVGQEGIATGSKGPPIRYEALQSCLTRLRAQLPERASVHMPRIGCGLAGGKWERIEPLIVAALNDVEVTVYDFE